MLNGRECETRLTELLAELVLANSAEVGSAAGHLEHPLGNTDGVQGGTT